MIWLQRMFWLWTATVLVGTWMACGATVPDVDAIIKNLTTSDLGSIVRLFTIYDDNFTLIVSSNESHGQINFDCTYVFEQPLTTLDSNYKSIQLMAPKRITDRWPALNGSGSYRNMVGIHARYPYIIFAGDNRVSALDTLSGVVSTVPLDDIARSILAMDPLLSVINKKFIVIYYVDWQICEGHLDNFPKATQMSFVATYFCDSDQGIFFSWDSCNSLVPWLKTGFVDDKNFVVFDQDNSVIVFPTAAYKAHAGEPVAFAKTDTTQFWTKFEPSTTVRPPPKGSTDSATVPHRRGRSNSTLAIVLSLVTVVLIAAVLYCYCSRSSSRKDGAPTASKNDRDGKSQNKANAKTNSKAQSSNPKSSVDSNLPKDGLSSSQNGTALKQAKQPNTGGLSGTSLGCTGPMKPVTNKGPLNQPRKAKCKKGPATKRGNLSSSCRSSSKGKRSSVAKI